MTSSPSPGDRERIRLVVLFGGRSAEHDVSCVSARHVLAAVDADRYDVEPIGITRDGQWVLAEGAVAALEAGADAMPDHLTAAGPSVDALPALAASDPATTVVLPVLHGPMGEDGTIQGLLELAGVPYVGAGVLASALCMDKVAFKDHLTGHGLPQCDYRWITVDGGVTRRPDGSVVELTAEIDAAIDQLGLPMFVKPANMGSSVGVSRASDVDGVRAAVELAATYDREVILEEEVVGREIEIAVLGNEDPEASMAGEIVPGADFYDYADKYDDGADLLIPAPLDDVELAEMQRLAIGAYRACKVEGLARVDFFYEDGSRDPSRTRGWLINEINTMPGFTPISMYPKMWQASGLDYPSLIDQLVELALARHARQKRHTRTDH
ncbi:MAG: D-alanine--D-alanine ligase family protein [Actinomycetota bacterium]